MPITLLHFGLLAPLNYIAPGKVSNISFIVVSLWMDGNSILYALFGLSGVAHGSEHSFLGASLLAAFIALFGARSLKWVMGAFIGGISHVLLDMLVHPEMSPLLPITGNQFYRGWMEPFSLALLPLTVWLIVQYVSGVMGWLAKRREVRRAALNSEL